MDKWVLEEEVRVEAWTNGLCVAEFLIPLAVFSQVAKAGWYTAAVVRSSAEKSAALGKCGGGFLAASIVVGMIAVAIEAAGLKPN